MKAKLCLLPLLAAFATASAVGSESLSQFTSYDKSLGKPIVDEIGDASFPGTIRLTGVLHVVRDDVDFCNGACAYFLPDTTSLARLPKKIIGNTRHTAEIEFINLYEARPVLVMAFGSKRASEILGPNLKVYMVPATLTINRFRIYGACDATHYEASVIGASLSPQLAKTTGRALLGGC